MADPELLDIDAVCALIGGNRKVHPATVYRGVRAGRWSKPISIGPNTSRWIRSEILADIARCKAERDGLAA